MTNRLKKPKPEQKPRPKTLRPKPRPVSMDEFEDWMIGQPMPDKESK